MAPKSTITRLPGEVRELIGKLRTQGRTIDEILEKLRELEIGVSRSALGRHLKQIDGIADEIGRKRIVAEAVVARFGDEPDDRGERLNIELMHALLTKAMVAEDGTTVDLNSREAMQFSTAVNRLVAASKMAAERELKIREEAKKEATEKAAEVVDGLAKEKGISPEVRKAWRAAVLGIKSDA